MPQPSRQGRVPDGWSKQGIVVPDPVWVALRALGERHGYGSLKQLCTVGMALVAGMPESKRMALMKWVAQAEVDGPESIKPEAMWTEMVRVMALPDTPNIQPIGRVRPMPVVPVNGPSGGEIAQQVTRGLDPDPLGKGKKKGAA